MQYMLEERDGTRMPITAEMASIARMARDESNRPMYRQVLATDSVEVLKREGIHMPVGKPLKYGGRGNVKSPCGYRGG